LARKEKKGRHKLWRDQNFVDTENTSHTKTRNSKLWLGWNQFAERGVHQIGAALGGETADNFPHAGWVGSETSRICRAKQGGPATVQKKRILNTAILLKKKTEVIGPSAKKENQKSEPREYGDGTVNHIDGVRVSGGGESKRSNLKLTILGLEKK